MQLCAFMYNRAVSYTVQCAVTAMCNVLHYTMQYVALCSVQCYSVQCAIHSVFVRKAGSCPVGTFLTGSQHIISQFGFLVWIRYFDLDWIRLA